MYETWDKPFHILTQKWHSSLNVIWTIAICQALFLSGLKASRRVGTEQKLRVETNAEIGHSTWGQDGDKTHLSWWFHSISLKLNCKRWAVICEAMIQVKRFKAEEKPELFNRIPRALWVIHGELRSDESFSSFHPSLSLWLFWCLLCTEVRMTDGTLGSTVQVDKRLSILNTITLLQVGKGRVELLKDI